MKIQNKNLIHQWSLESESKWIPGQNILALSLSTFIKFWLGFFINLMIDLNIKGDWHFCNVDFLVSGDYRDVHYYKSVAFPLLRFVNNWAKRIFFNTLYPVR